MSNSIRDDIKTAGIWGRLHQVDLRIMQFGPNWKTEEGTLIYHSGKPAEVHYYTSPDAVNRLTDDVLHELEHLLDDEDAYVKYLVDQGILHML